MNIDPNRRLRLNDRVRLIEWRGRKPHEIDFDSLLPAGQLATVDEDENETSAYVRVRLDEQPGETYTIPIYNLELVEAAETKPYWIEARNDGKFHIYTTRNNGEPTLVATIFWHPASEGERVSHATLRPAALNLLTYLNATAISKNNGH